MKNIYRLNTKIRLTMLCLSGFELYSRWVPLIDYCELVNNSLWDKGDCCRLERLPKEKKWVLAFVA